MDEPPLPREKENRRINHLKKLSCYHMRATKSINVGIKINLQVMGSVTIEEW